MKNKVLFYFLVFASGCIFGASTAAASTDVTEDITSETIWDEAGSPYLVYKKIYVYAPLTIKPGVIVKFQYYGTGPAGSLSIKSELNAVGTPEKKIIFTSLRDDGFGGDDNHDGNATQPARGNWYGINIYDNNYNSRIEYVTVLYSDEGISYGNYSVSNFRGLILRNSEIKFCTEGLNIFSTVPIIENNKIENNRTGIVAYSDPAKGRMPTFHNNSIVQNTIAGLNGQDIYGLRSIKIDARHNWWGDANGPANPAVNGNRVLGSGVMFDPWLAEAPKPMPKKPVILIPGIGASVNWDLMLGGVFPERWTLMSHTYDGIIEALEAMGYEKGYNLFICYYDWRSNNAVSAENYLKPIIDKALSESGAYKVNIVAHSMGGLLARNYIQSYEYRNDVESLIMIGTPNKGSSDVYPVWEGGRIPNNWEGGALLRSYLRYMDVKKITFSNFKTVHQFIPSVKELMPVYNYIHPKDNPNFLKNYNTDMREVNSWLIALNSGTFKLNARTKVISISGNAQTTVNKIPVIDANEAPLWIDGKPEPIDPVRNDTAGDKRVLLSSSQIQSYFSKVLNYDHGDIVDQSETLIADLLEENLDDIHPSPEIRDELAFWFASPVDVEIKSPDGKRITKDENNIPLAIYSGESKLDGFKFVSVPNPIKGDYKIKITGNGEGEFHAGSIYADYENGVPDQESEAEGAITEEEIKKYKLKYNPDDISDPVGDIELADTIPPVITITSPEDQKSYLNDQVIPVDYSVTDDTSASENIAKTIEYDSADFSADEIDLSLQYLGEHELKITATDEARNTGEKTITFQDTTNLNAIQNNINHYWDLKLIKKKIAKRYLIIKLKHLEKLFNLLEKTENSKLKPKPKQAAIDALKKVINADINRLIKQINRRSPRWFDQNIADLLTESLGCLKIN